jgi:protein-S-isoprenylcysteine O-methyltransferase Ste14
LPSYGRPSCSINSTRSTGQENSLFSSFASPNPKRISVDPFDWLVGIGGTFSAFFFVPGGFALLPAGEQLVLVAVVLQILGLLSLNRSFGIVAANRAIKTGGMYRLVRHPLYSSYVVLFSGYLLFNVSAWNVFVLLLAFTFVFFRIDAEEKMLMVDPEYRAYAQKIRWKLIPFVY